MSQALPKKGGEYPTYGTIIGGGELDSDFIEDSTYLTSQVILPIYFSYGIIIWLAIAAVWACQCFKSDTQKVRTLDCPQKEIEIVANKFTFSNKRDQSLIPRELIM